MSNSTIINPSRTRGKRNLATPAGKPKIIATNPDRADVAPEPKIIHGHPISRVEIRPDGTKVDGELVGARRRFRRLTEAALELCTAQSLDLCAIAMSVWIDADTKGQTDYMSWRADDKAAERAERERKQRFNVLDGGMR